MTFARNPAWTKHTGSHAEQHILQFLYAHSDDTNGENLSWLHDANRKARPEIPRPTKHGDSRRYEWPDGSALSVAWNSQCDFAVHRDHLEEARVAIARHKATHKQAAEVAWPDTDPALCRPPTASGTAPHYSYAWAPCDENGELDGDDDSAVFHSAVSEQAADDELASFPYGGFLRRTAPDGTHEHDWGGGYRATIVDAVAACIGLDDLDDEEEDWEDEEFDEEELQELHENPSAPPPGGSVSLGLDSTEDPRDPRRTRGRAMNWPAGGNTATEPVIRAPAGQPTRPGSSQAQRGEPSRAQTLAKAAARAAAGCGGSAAGQHSTH